MSIVRARDESTGDEEFIYLGMSGRGAQREDFVANSGRPSQAKGLTHMLPAGDPGTSSTSTSVTGSSCLGALSAGRPYLNPL